VSCSASLQTVVQHDLIRNGVHRWQVLRRVGLSYLRRTGVSAGHWHGDSLTFHSCRLCTYAFNGRYGMVSRAGSVRELSGGAISGVETVAEEDTLLRWGGTERCLCFGG
jgi:hypothetical protein